MGKDTIRILQVINEIKPGGGAEKLLMDLSIGMKQCGVDVSVLSIRRPIKDDFVKTLNNNGIATYSLCQKLYTVNNIFKICKFLKQVQCDIVHVHLFPSLYYCGLAKLLGANKKLIYTEHSTNNRRRNNVLFKCLDKIIYQQYNTIVSISNTVYENLYSHIGTLQKNIIENAVNFEKYNTARTFPIREYLGLSKNSYVVMMVARFVEGKDYLTLFKSLLHLPPEVHAVCIGDGPEMERCKEYAEVIKVNRRVHFLGLRKDVDELLKSSDIVVLSSEHEGFSISMLEAMASGKPFVASCVPGLIDILGDNALFFQYKDYKQLAQVILKLKNNENVYHLYSEKSLKFAAAHDLSGMIESYLRLYKKILQ